MSSSEPLNFGRKIKELKRIHKKGYADLTVGLKISRERLLQLEENEREPNEAERRRFAAFYNMPVEEFGLIEGGGGTPPPAPGPAPTPRPAPGPGPNSYGNNYTPNPGAGERRFDNPPFQGGERQNNFQERSGNYQGGERQGNFQERSGNFQGGERQGGFQDRRPNPNYGGGPGGGRPGGPGGGQQRPGFGGPGGGRPSGPGAGGPRPGPNGARQDQPQPRRDPAEPREPKEPKEPKSGEAKPIMKYTAEQLGDIESAYLRKQRDLKVPLTFTFLNGKQYTGVVLDFTPFTVHIQETDSGQEVILRKLAMAYYRKADAASEGEGGKE